MKRVVVIPIEPGKKNGERRKVQRRTSVPRRIRPSRSSRLFPEPAVLTASERRNSADRRRLPDRRLGLSLDLDWSELE
ncbi:MAG TPA: hypothetical protein VKJ00_12730 [Thermoanaerobaculia bacterium]|nr:hypothetical protein [Thermoanaerobaculia bacterium]